MHFAIYETSGGRITSVADCNLQEQIAHMVDEGRTAAVECKSDTNGATHYIENGAVVAMPPKPSEYHRFDYTLKQWQDPRTLQDLKDARNLYVNTERLKANQTSFTHVGKMIAVDALSRSDIDAVNGEVANTGALPAGWPGAWKCLDNSYLPVASVADWKAFYTSMVNQGTQNFGHSQALKAQIEAATTPEEVTSIVW